MGATSAETCRPTLTFKMKLQILALALLIPLSSHAADDVAVTRARTAAVDKAAPKATIIKRELQGYSLEGGELTAYFQKGVPLKMVAKHFGESGRATEEFYFWQGRLFFVLRTDENYQNSVTMQPDPGKITRYQSRYYFKNGVMWRWINEEGKIVKSGAEFKSEEQANLSFAREMLAGARGKSKTIEAPK